LGCSRNAIYKILFDARRKLRSSLTQAGYNLHGDEERP
jgi:DNA-directed RNA polymerase specialized sigma24 family protein